MSEALGASGCALPSRTGGRLDVIPPTPSFVSGPANPPFMTQAPALLRRAQGDTCSSTPNEVLLKISTQVLIPDYSNYYSATPISQFRMAYSSFPDGSLVASPYVTEVRHGDWTLLFAGMMLMLFISTSIVAADYIRRVKVKHKSLFYALLISQLCGVVSFTITAATVLADEINCRDAFIAVGIFTEVSSALLLSGILGIKAYRCLGDSKAVLCVIFILQVASSSLLFADLAKLDASRKFSLHCETANNRFLFSLATTARFVLALFICCCFVYAVWKSEKFPAAQGRISIALSGPTPPPLNNENEKDLSVPRPRGWWDYVPDRHVKSAQEERVSTWHIIDDQGFVGNMRYLMGTWMKNESSGRAAQRKGSEATLVATPQRKHRSRPSVVHFQVDLNEHSRFSVASRAQSSTPSKTRSLGPLMNRMRLFREVMRSELAYTALITLFNVIATVLGLVGVFARMSTIDPEVFIGAYWGILSLLVMQSFRRVVHRHEREALLQHPSTWDPLYHVEKATNGEVRQGLSATASVSSNPWRARSIVDPLSTADENIGPLDRQEGPSKGEPTTNENPFEDFEFAGPSSRRDADTNASTPEDDLFYRAPGPSTRAGAINANVLAPSPLRRAFRDSVSLGGTESLARDSVSKYSDYSSRPQSLFYLEKTR